MISAKEARERINTSYKGQTNQYIMYERNEIESLINKAIVRGTWCITIKHEIHEMNKSFLGSLGYNVYSDSSQAIISW